MLSLKTFFECYSITKVHPYFLKLMGSSQLPIRFSLKDLNSFEKMIKIISKEEKKINAKTSNQIKILIGMIKFKIAIYFDEKEHAAKYMSQIKKDITNLENNKDGRLLNLYVNDFIFFKELLELETMISNWIELLENKVKSINNEISVNAKEMNEIVDSYKEMTVNSPEHLLKSKRHLEIIVGNTLLEGEKINAPHENFIKDGELILSMLTAFKEKLIRTGFVKLTDGKYGFLSKSNTHAYLIYRKVEIEILKVKFYLNYELEELFKEASNFIIEEYAVNPEKPLEVLLNNFLPVEIKKNSIHLNQHLFYNFIRSFNLKYNKDDTQLNIQLLSEPIQE